MATLTTILGSGGVIGNGLANILCEKGVPFRVVSRTAHPVPGAEFRAADLADPEQTAQAVAGSSLVYLLVGLKYDHRVWEEQWPRIMRNVVEACKRAQAKLVFFDNVYMYGKVHGPMTEETPYNPCCKKGEVRAKIARTLLDEIRAGGITAIIARAADFYGPEARNSAAGLLVFDALAKGKRPSWLVNDAVPHSATFTPDAARALVDLAERDSAWNQVWHLPTAPNAPTGKEFVAMAAGEFGTTASPRVLSRPMLRLAGLFSPVVRGSYEMLYQSDSPYVFDSSKYAKEFGLAGTPYAEGIRLTARWYRAQGEPQAAGSER
jgi:nucleoside-diphosphate-sugar epimerase